MLENQSEGASPLASLRIQTAAADPTEKSKGATSKLRTKNFFGPFYYPNLSYDANRVALCERRTKWTAPKATQTVGTSKRVGAAKVRHTVRSSRARRAVGAVKLRTVGKPHLRQTGGEFTARQTAHAPIHHHSSDSCSIRYASAAAAEFHAKSNEELSDVRWLQSVADTMLENAKTAETEARSAKASAEHEAAAAARLVQEAEAVFSRLKAALTEAKAAAEQAPEDEAGGEVRIAMATATAELEKASAQYAAQKVLRGSGFECACRCGCGCRCRC